MHTVVTSGTESPRRPGYAGVAMAPRNLLITALVAAGALALLASSVAFAATTMGGWFGGGSHPAATGGNMASHMSGGMGGMHGGSGPATADQPTVTAGGPQVTVEMVNMSFQPANLQITPGTTVTWVNKDPAPHTATAADRSWDSGIFNQGQSWSHTFDTPGRYDYVCLVHPGMAGTITVAP